MCTIASHQPRIKESEQTCVRQWRRGDRRDVSCPLLRSRVVRRNGWLDTMHAGRPIRSYGGVGRKPCLSLTATTLRSGYLATPCRCRCRCRRRIGSTNKRPLVPVGARAHSLSQLARLGAVGIQDRSWERGEGKGRTAPASRGRLPGRPTAVCALCCQACACHGNVRTLAMEMYTVATLKILPLR